VTSEHRDLPDAAVGVDGRDEDGSTLILMPAAVLVLLALAAIAVDSAAIYLGQRRVADLAAGLANDAVAAVTEAAFYEEGEVRVQASRAAARQQQLLAGLTEDGAFRDVRCDVQPAGDAATASCVARVEPIFGRALRRDGGTVVRATETARAEQG
jgi:uncharacterized membrane protein